MLCEPVENIAGRHSTGFPFIGISTVVVAELLFGLCGFLLIFVWAAQTPASLGGG